MMFTLVTASSFPVLILAAITANIRVTTDTSSIKNKDLMTVPTMSSPFIAFSSETNPGVTDAHFIQTNLTEQNDYDKNNITLLEKYNCILEEMNQKNCSSVNITSSDVIPAANISRAVVTYRDFKEYQYYKNVISILPYSSNIPGIITNSLTIIVAANIKPLHTSEMYMISLGFADFLTVCFRCAHSLWSIYADEMSVIGCKVPRYILHIPIIYSNLTLMAWTIERFIAVIFPLKLATWCSIRNTKITLTLLLLLCFLLAIPYLTEHDIYSFNIGKETVTVCFETYFFKAVWSHIESFYYIYIPVVCVCACNIAILCRLRSTVQTRINMTSDQDTVDKRTNESRKITIVLLTISGCFILLHIPIAIILVFSYIYPDLSILMSEDPHFFAKFLFYSTLGFVITEYQNSVNFFLYCISGNKFRASFKKIFCHNVIKTKRTSEVQSPATLSTKF